MISEKIKAVFEFINFLHSNTRTFKEYVPIVDECLSLGKEMYLLKPDNSFNENKKYKELEAIRNPKIKIVYSNVVGVITKKALSLNIFNEATNFNCGYEDIRELQQQATDSDLPEINKQKNLYLEFRNQTKSYFLSFHIFFNDLDRYLKILFSYFDKEAFKEFDELKNSAFPQTKIDRPKPLNLDKWKFGDDFYLMSDEKFKKTIFKKFSTQYTDDQLNQVIEKFKMENTPIKKKEAQEKINAKAYINSLYSYKNFKKSMSESTSNTYYTNLSNKWDEARKKYIEENKLQEISWDLDFVFSGFLNNIFTLYKHAFKYYELDSLKDMNQIEDKRRRFDCLMNENVNDIVSNLKSEKVKGNYKLVLDRKDYIIGLFNSLESYLVNASINFSKSPFLEIFTTSKEKINNCISFEEIKFLATSTKQAKIQSQTLNIDWLEVFENIDITKDIDRQVHKTTNYEQKKDYFSKASFNLTLQYFQRFKKETDFLTSQRKLDYINALDIKSPNINNSESPTFNQTVFEANQNYFEFINTYKAYLKFSIHQQSHTVIQKPSSNNNAENALKTIWLAESKISIIDFLNKGVDKGIWSENHKITVKKGSVYSTGKTLLGSLSIALKGYAISEQTDYKVIGEAFCIAFSEPIKETTENPFKAFSSGNPKVVNELKKAYNIKL